MSVEDPTPTTVDALLGAARAQLARLTPAAALERQGDGAVLIDIRSESQRARDGALPGAAVVARNVLEWRLDPASPHCDLASSRGAIAR
jgi:rhodanese-related sulfurtransferase